MARYFTCGGCGEVHLAEALRCDKCQRVFAVLPKGIPFFTEKPALRSPRPNLELVRAGRSPENVLSPASEQDRFRLNDLKLMILGILFPPMVLIASLYHYSQGRPRSGKILLMTGILGSTAWCILGLLALADKLTPAL
jgi:hypothetical protein